MLAENLNMKSGRSSGAMTRIVWITSSRSKKPLGRVEPDRLVGQRGEHFLIALIAKPAAAAGGRQNHGELRHAGVSLFCTISGKSGQAPFAGTALRVLRTKGACPLFPSHCAVLRPCVKTPAPLLHYRKIRKRCLRRNSTLPL